MFMDVTFVELRNTHPFQLIFHFMQVFLAKAMAKKPETDAYPGNPRSATELATKL